MYIICCGMYRSCSTWQYQVAGELAERQSGHKLGFVDDVACFDTPAYQPNGAQSLVFKTHDIYDRYKDWLRSSQAKAIYSYRDIREVTVSLMHKLALNFEQIMREDSPLRRNLEAYYQWVSMPNTLVQRYETIVAAPHTAVREIADHLGYSITDAEADEIVAKFSLKANLQRAAALKSDLLRQHKDLSQPERSLAYDSDSLIHWNHIRDTSNGGWRSILTSAEDLARLAHFAGHWLIETGYERDVSWAAAAPASPANNLSGFENGESNTGMKNNPATTITSWQHQWLHPVQVGTSTLRNIGAQQSTIEQIITILRQLQSDEYITFMIDYYQKGLERFGEHWEYNDQLTILYAASKVLKPQSYLEIGVFRGRSMSVVATVAPDCHMYGFDLWIENYSGLDNPGPAFVKSQLQCVGHRGDVTLTAGNSGETVPTFLHSNPDLFFDLITVDGDHTEEGARIDLQNVLPRVNVGGVLVFDDICHPLHPSLERVWDEVVGSNINFVSMKYTEAGHGVAFAIRHGTNTLADGIVGDAEERRQQMSLLLNEMVTEQELLHSRVSELQEQLAAAEDDRNARLKAINHLSARLAESEDDRAARLQVIEEQRHQLDHSVALRDQLEADSKQLSSQFEQLRNRWSALRPVLIGLRSSPIYRLARALGRWDWLERALDSALSTRPPPAELRPTASKPANVKLQRVAVDLTPVLPGGENGGAKFVALSVIQYLGQIAHECEFILLTAERSHDQLAWLDAPNVRRLCVLSADQTAPRMSRGDWLRMQASSRLKRVLPARAMDTLKWTYRKVFRQSQQTNILRELRADLIFCPFTASLYYDPAIPTVGVVYDLQFLYYPQFFSSEERSSRSRHFTELCRVATQLICISDYVRNTVLENSSVEADRIRTVHIQLPHQLPQPSNQLVGTIRERFGLADARFLLYPANFWPHKNHRMLLTAFGMYRVRHPEIDVKLVLTGSPGADMSALQEAAAHMGLGDKVVFAGYLADQEFAALLHASFAVIYPSLYEGFGMPLIEAMAVGKPVLCSDIGSLTEVAGEAALLFDPRNPESIASAIERILSEPELVSELIARGYQRLPRFDKLSKMAHQYWDIFQEAFSGQRYYADGMHGVYADGWTSQNVTVTYGASEDDRQLEIVLSAPDWIPHSRLATLIKHNDNSRPESHVIARGQTMRISRPLPHGGGYLELMIDPVFQPKSLGLNDDERGLGCVFQECRVISHAGVTDLLATRNL